MDKNTHYRQWWIRAGVGLNIIGLGLCLVIDAGYVKHQVNPDFWRWVLQGSLGLAVFNAGISIFGSSIIHRINYERCLRMENKDNKSESIE